MEYQEAVDLVLQFTGETPVNAPHEHPNQGVITRFINSSIAREQLLDWWFNVDYELTLQADSLGKVPISSSIKKIVFEESNYVARGKWVYDNVNQTYLIRSSVAVLKATRELQWEDLPELMQQWCMFQGAKYYILGTIGDGGLTKELKEEAGRTNMQLKVQDLESKNINIFNTPKIARTRSRRMPYGGR
jgi:hypothetical protein